MPTPSQMEVWTNAIVRDCLLCCGGDVGAGLAAAELILSTQPVPTNKETKPSISAFFAYDIHNRHAQGILNRTLKAAKGLTDNARKDLATALKDSATDSGQAILEFIDKYRLQLAKLLTTTQLASLLEGAREVAAKVPVLEEDAEALGPTPQPTFPKQDGIHLVTIEEAAKQLGEKNVLTRGSFDALEAAARAKAFTVAGVDASDTLEKIRDVLAKNVKEGADYETFKSQVMEAVDEGTFLSDAHTETVFRTNVQGAFSDGQMAVLQNPLVRSGFPYSAYDSIHDDRVRAEHLSLDKHGIDGSNVYRTDDPVFQTFRPPWDYNCRCSWTVMTVRQAAEAGVKEAKEWLDTGVEPSPPHFVAMPPFEPPPGFQRALMDAPLSVRLSLQPTATFSHDVSGEKRDDKGRWTKEVWKYSDRVVEHDSWRDLEAESEYVYHATNTENAADVQESALVPHKPSYGTHGQRVWPDGSTAKRIYMIDNPADAWKFAPEEGKPALLRIKRRKTFKTESTGDIYLEGKKIPSHLIEILTKDGWKPLKNPPDTTTENATALSIKEGNNPEEETDTGLLYGASEGAGPTTMAALDTAKEPSARKPTHSKRGKGKSSRERRRLFKRLRVKKKWAPVALSRDVEGHEHKGKGKGGGQFTDKGNGGSIDEASGRVAKKGLMDWLGLGKGKKNPDKITTKSTYIEPQWEGLSPTHQKAINRTTASMKKQKLPEEQKTAYKKAVIRVVSSMSKNAADIISNNVQGAKWLSNTKEMTAYYASQTGAKLEKGDEIYGFWDNQTGLLSLDGVSGNEGDKSDILPDEGQNIHGTYAHELTHAIDQATSTNGTWTYKFSSTPEWQQAYEKEIVGEKGSGPRLSEYARTATWEGFAEFGRALYGSDAPREEVAKHFPMCYAFFQKNRLVD